MITLNGIGASPGIVVGKAALIRDRTIELTYEKIKPEEITQEIERFKVAILKAKEEIEVIRVHTEQNIGSEEAAVFTAHLMILDDPELVQGVVSKIKTELISVENAVNEVIKNYTEMLSALGDEYIKARVTDMEDIGQRLLLLLTGSEKTQVELDKETILVAKDLSPSVTAQLNTDSILAFATQSGSRSSHTAILARCLGIPAAVGLGEKLLEVVTDGDNVIVDGNDGVVIVNPDQMMFKDYQSKIDLEEQEMLRLSEYKHKIAATADGLRIKIMGNIGAVNEVDAVLENGGEGSGLFRTEFLYMKNEECLPSEQQQYLSYKAVAEKMNGKEVVIRTLDIGGDKELASLNLSCEENPFLGYRAIRICLDREDVFKPQLRAILRASAYGDLKIMFPMISSLEELRSALYFLGEVKQELKNEGIPFKDDIEVGIMVEVPSAAIMADTLAKEVDFFSIGTNDLVQYTLAADRNNEKVSAAYNHYHPAVLKLIKLVTDAAHNNGIWVGMCGEASGDELLLPLWVSLRFEELSMSSVSILKAKKIISLWNLKEAELLSEKVLTADTSTEVKQLLESASKLNS
ncbi:MAG: phosphoenolpyruvate--protein phosphotransferase [Bacillota bacterium]